MAHANMTQANPKVGSRNADTREKLISAAIECLAQFGFSGTNMRLVVAQAGVTQGPRQYYFPSPNDLYSAVVDRIHGRADEFVAKTVENTQDGTIRERLEGIVYPAFKHCGSPNHLAMIELKLACRGDQQLNDAISPRIKTYERAADQIWAEIFADSNLGKETLIELRTVFGATVRGLGVAMASGENTRDPIEVANALINMMMASLDPETLSFKPAQAYSSTSNQPL